MEMNMGEAIILLVAFIVIFSFVVACIEAAGEQRKREREQREREALQRMPVTNLLPLTEILKIETRLPLPLIEINDKLLDDIVINGIQEPIEVRVRADGSRIVWDGLHRLAIAVKLGLETVPVFFIGM